MAVGLADVATTLLRATPEGLSAEGKAWAMWIADARRQIQARLGDLDQLDQDNLDYVVREAVALKAKRPDPATKIDISVDDSSLSKTYEKAAGQVIILDDWWNLLSPGSDAGAWTIRPSGTGPACRPWWAQC